MIAPEFYYPLLTGMFFLLNAIMAGVSGYAFFKTHLPVFLILVGSGFFGMVSNIGEFLLTIIQILDREDEWRNIGVFTYNSLIITQPLAALLCSTGIVWLAVLVIGFAAGGKDGDTPLKKYNG